MSVTTTRAAAVAGATITALGVCYALAGITGWSPGWGPPAQALLHLGELAVVVALVGSRVAGPGRGAGIGFGLAVLGQVLLVVAELVYPASANLGDALFGLGPLLTGIGMVVAGIFVLRARSWRGRVRVLPLLVGVWILVPTTPIVLATGGPPHPLALAAIAMWDALWLLTAIGVLSANRDRVADPARADA